MAKLIVCLCLIMGGWYCLTSNAYAAQPNGIVISPPIQSVILQPHQESIDIPVQIRNATQATVDLVLSSVDFGNLDQSGGVLFAGLNKTDFNRQHGLADWLSLDQSQLTLAAGAQATVTAHLINATSLTPGGHYGAVLVTVNNSTQGSQIGVTQSLASLLLVTKQGGEVYGIDLHKLHPDDSWWGRISEANAEFRNDGNVHAVPRGTVEVVDPAGRTIGKGIINPDSTILLPGQSRTLNVPIKQTGLALWPGTYQVVSHYRYDGTQVLQMRSQTFYQIGLITPILLILTLAGGGWWLQRHLQNNA